MAVADFGSLVLLPLSFALGGMVVEAVGPEMVLLAAGTIGVLTAATGLVVPAVHRWRLFADDMTAGAAARQEPRSSPLPGGQTR
jgi:hypothetical protein